MHPFPLLPNARQCALALTPAFIHPSIRPTTRSNHQQTPQGGGAMSLALALKRAARPAAAAGK